VHNHFRAVGEKLGAAGLAERFTRREVGRILGLESSRLRYWERLKLVRPRARWGERFYGFGDLVALRAIQRLTAGRIPARRVRHVVTSLERRWGRSPLPLEELTLIERGRSLAVLCPGTNTPFDPMTGQWLLPFEAALQAGELRHMASQTAEELFQSALDCESRPELVFEAIENYRRVIELAPDWVEAHINLGVALYQLGRTEEAQSAFQAAVRLDPENGISRYNLGCVLEERGETDAAIEHLRQAARVIPAHPDVHFNLALAYDKRGERRLAREQWLLYLRYAPNGPWAEQARSRLRQSSGRNKTNPPIPFPRKA
jgi:Flp pilus assembly protein TadD